MRTTVAALLFALVLMVPATCWSGPNEGGVLIYHSPAEIAFSSGRDYCGQSGLEHCADADVRVEGDGVATVFLLAAFSNANSPRLAGASFGIDYSADDIEIVEWGVCGDFHLYTNDWPGPGSGSAVTWAEAQTDHVVEIHWFTTRSVSGNPATLNLTEHPHGGGAAFGDDSVPSNIDYVAEFGRLGFGGDEGYLPCPDPVPIEQTTWGKVKASYRARD